MKKLSVMEAKLKATKEQLKSLEKKKVKLENQIIKYKLENTLYHSMSELINYKERKIGFITLVKKQPNGRLSMDSMCNDEVFYVTDDGHLYYSSSRGGVMKYDEEDGKYYRYVFGRSTPYEYVGFLEIKFEDEY